MARLLGVEIPSNKKIEYALCYVHGIGLARSRKVLEIAKIDPNVRTHEITEAQFSKIVEVIAELDYEVEGDLRRKVIADIRRLQSIKCYRGLRHMRGLPVRGQRTRTNSRTRKGAKKPLAAAPRAK